MLTLTPPQANRTPTSISVESGAISNIIAIVPELKKASSVVVLFDAGIESIAKDVIKSIGRDVVQVSVKSGDSQKSLSEADRIITKLLDAGCTRSTIIVTVGGGMMTDLGGFIASMFMRGVPCVHVPTSLLAMVDAAIGGKTAVNAGKRKNMIGTIHHPLAVICDIDLLKNLPDAQMSEGLVEAIKVTAIADKKLFEWFEKNMEKIVGRDVAAMTEAVEKSIAVKVRIVQDDERDHHVRQLLNFGHTVGHAVEALSEYKLSHGKAISIGMIAEMTLAQFAEQGRVKKLLSMINMPLAIPEENIPDALWALMKLDKKNTDARVMMAVPDSLGHGVVSEITPDQFKKLFS